MNKRRVLQYFSAYDLLALGAGMLLTLAFAPFNIFPLAFLCPAILLFTWLSISRWRAFWRGWLFGFGFFATGVYWIFISVHTYGNANVFLSLFISISLFAILALFPAASGYYLNRYFPSTNPAKMIYAFPVIWVFFEWVRSWIFSGFTWLSLGYSQLHSPLRGFASLYCVYGVSLMILVTVGLCYEIVFEFRQKQTRRYLGHLFSLVFIWSIGAYFSHHVWTHAAGQPIKVALVQGNIPQEIKWSADQIYPTLRTYKDLSDEHWDSQLIIWPEGAIPVPMPSSNDYIDTMSDDAEAHHAGLIVGVPVEAKQGYYNGVIALGAAKGSYVKRRLVPFGEYTPLPSLFNRLMGKLDIPMADFVPGKGLHPPIQAFGTKIDTYVCYEITFPEQVLNHDPDIGMILTVNNDAWFGRSFAQAQHWQMGQMRAIETGRPVIYVSNNGITGIIKPNGQVQSKAPPFQEYVLTDSVQPVTGLTPWDKLGLDPLLISMFGMLWRAIRMRKQRSA